MAQPFTFNFGDDDIENEGRPYAKSSHETCPKDDDAPVVPAKLHNLPDMVSEDASVISTWNFVCPGQNKAGNHPD